MEGVYVLVYKYFQKPIDELLAKSRMPDEELRLKDLKFYFELLEELLQEKMGGSLAAINIDDISFIVTGHEGDNAAAQTALSKLGNTGGETYWRWYGYTSRVEWSGCFVSWCLNQNGYAYPKFSSLDTGVKWCKNNSKWQEPDFADIAPGDLIFFDWEGKGKAQHVGLVIGIDEDGYVYTVEGNDGDTVKIRKYELTNQYIMGYGTIT